jgi:hypothetical protein
MTLGFTGLYWRPGGDAGFRKAWKKTGKKLDMGVSCIRFKTLDDLPLKLIGETVREMTVKKFIAIYQSSIGSGRAWRKARKPAKKAAKKKK